MWIIVTSPASSDELRTVKSGMRPELDRVQVGELHAVVSFRQ